MLIKSFPAGPWATNCYLVANEANSECIIIDPGFESLSGIKRIAEQFGLHPVATLLTHGHMDHVWSVVPLCKEHNIAAEDMRFLTIVDTADEAVKYVDDFYKTHDLSPNF